MLLQSTWYLDCSSWSATLSIIPKQEGKGVKKCIMLYAQFTEGSMSFVESLVLSLMPLFSWIVLGLLVDVGQQRTWLTVCGSTCLWIFNVEQILYINYVLNRIENIHCSQCVLYDRCFHGKLKYLILASRDRQASKNWGKQKTVFEYALKSLVLTRDYCHH